MNFCARCETYLAPEAASCPNCGALRPPAEAAAALWSVELNQPPAGPPLVASDLLLLPTQEPGLPSQHGTLHALNLADGGPRWQRNFEYAMVSGLATVQTLKVLETFRVLLLVTTASTDLLRGEGTLLALDASGQECWRWAPGAQRVSAPAVAGDVVCVTADAQTLVLLDLDSGAERARHPLPPGMSASLAAPAVAGDVAHVPCRGPYLLAVGLDGQLRWRFTAQASPNAWLDQTPVVVGEHVYAVLGIGTVVALQAEDGSLVWRADVGPTGKRLSPPASDGQRLYLGARDGLHALDLADGRAAWSFPTPRRVAAAPVVAGGVVYAACHDHHLYALDAATGQQLWLYEAERRVELPPAVTSPPEARALIADRSGTITAIARPLSAAEHEAAGHWVKAASAYATLGQFARGAQLLEVHGEPFKAAELWKAAGERERAAAGYEAAGAWGHAAERWADLGRPLKRAEALERHARSLEDGPSSDEEKAAAWAAAAGGFEVAGEIERAAACQREVCRYRRLPVITMGVKHAGLVRGAYSCLQFIVRNEGYGPARNLVIRASGDQFEGQVAVTRQIVMLPAGRERIDWLDVRPRAYGDSVPLRVRAEYEDRAGQIQAFEQTLYIPVARSEAARGAGQVLYIGEGLDIAPSPEASRLHQVLITHLNLEELRTLCFDLGVNYDHLAGEELRGKARELVLYLQRRDALPRLIEWLRRERPDIKA